MIERRKFVRWKCSLESIFKNIATKKSGSFSSPALIEDLSAAGARLRTSKFIPLTESLILHLKIVGQPEIVLRAKPMWFYEMKHVSFYDIGVQFVELTADGKEGIAKCIDYLKGSQILPKGDIE